mmetsp:Transcript_7440/g.12594  ORF Transcript_7440/g.12594 Transcript_7440/m.12594 type:complete len:136 (+) Transcript_7440:105-512(+)
MLRCCEQCQIVTFEVESLWTDEEAAWKANAWIQANKPGEGWKFNGKWHNAGSLSTAEFTRKVRCGIPVVEKCTAGTVNGENPDQNVKTSDITFTSIQSGRHGTFSNEQSTRVPTSFRSAQRETRGESIGDGLVML